ncbi:MAG: stage III sporulation protein AB [Clostridia bacterium]|nr:stage III sporulation protein AB [Clostridia bacterium]
MLILKLSVAIAIVAICTVLGMMKSKKYESREYILREAIGMFKGIKNEINYTLTPIPNAIEAVRQNMKTVLREVMGAVSFELLQYNVSVENVANEIARLEELTPYDRQVISNGIISLGKTDVEGQMGVINMTCNTLENQLEDSIEDKKKNSKLYKTVGLATGLVIAIVFI